MNNGNFGIVVSGGPAPGINSVIASVVVRASDTGHKVLGLNRGFHGIVNIGQEVVQELTPKSINHIANTGGSVLGTSRFNPFENDESKSKLFNLLKHNDIDKLVVIGGEGSAYLSYKISQELPKVRVAHIPKTIDNDLILPNKHPSFGFETARFAGCRILNTIMADAKTTNRWFIVRTMGRKAGFLALGLGMACGVAITIIAEQFKDKKVITLDDVVLPILNSLKKRRSEGKEYGTAVIAEGIIDMLDPDCNEDLKNCPRDDMGRLRFAEVSLEDIIAKRLRELCAKEDIDTRFSVSDIGYELRCREPVPFDIEYTKLLGFGAVEYLLEGKKGIMVVRDFDNLAWVPLEHMIDENKLSLKTRSVDINSDVFKMASSFMNK